MKVLIVGGRSQAGLALARVLDARHLGYAVMADLKEALSDPVPLQRTIADYSPDFVVSCPDEYDWPWLASDAAVAAVKGLSRLCLERKIGLVQLSTEHVFDGTKTSAYTESDEPNPQSAIGQACWQIEETIRQHCPYYLILRTSWVFGPDGDNGLTRLLRQAVTESVIRVDAGERSCPTAAADLARVLVAMMLQVDCDVEPPLWGTYHYVGSDVANRAIFAETVVKAAKSYVDVSVERVETTEQEQNERVQNTELSSRKVLNVFGIKQHPWRRGVQESLKQLYETTNL